MVPLEKQQNYLQIPDHIMDQDELNAYYGLDGEEADGDGET